MNDPLSPEYKRARRKYLNSLKARDPAIESDWTPFRATEKKYKVKYPPPNLVNVLDLALLDSSRAEEISRGRWAGRPDAVECHKLPSESVAAHIVPQVPGLVILPNFLSHSKQKDLIQWALDEQTSTNETNLHAHYTIPPPGIWQLYQSSVNDPAEDVIMHPKFDPTCSTTDSNSGPRQLINNEAPSVATLDSLITTPKPPPPPSSSVPSLPISKSLYKLRWTNIGWFYHWGTKQYDFVRGKAPIRQSVTELCQNVVQAVDWQAVYSACGKNDMPPCHEWPITYAPDAGIVNFYQNKDSLMAHVDRSELCETSPLVSISLGNAAVFLIGDNSRETTPTAILLRSGDIVIMSGPSRRAYHGVPRILEDTSPFNVEGNDWDLYSNFMKTTRININLRQVFPPNFTPPVGTQ